MKYYLKKCGHQELGSVGADGKAQRGRYLLTSMDENVLSIFPSLTTAQLNDSALLPIIPLYSKKKVYCNFVYPLSTISFSKYIPSGIYPNFSVLTPNSSAIFSYASSSLRTIKAPESLL